MAGSMPNFIYSAEDCYYLATNRGIGLKGEASELVFKPFPGALRGEVNKSVPNFKIRPLIHPNMRDEL